MAKANLLVTYDPTHPGKAKDEVKILLGETGEDPEFLQSGIEGIFLIRIEEPKKTVKKLVEICSGEPDKFGYTFRWIPVDKWSSSDIGDMSAEIRNLEDKIDDNEKWKLDLTKRKYDKYSTTDLIMSLTENIGKPNVDLKKPDKIVKVDIIGEQAAISLLNAGEYLDVQKMKSHL